MLFSTMGTSTWFRGYGGGRVTVGGVGEKGMKWLGQGVLSLPCHPMGTGVGDDSRRVAGASSVPGSASSGHAGVNAADLASSPSRLDLDL